MDRFLSNAAASAPFNPAQLGTPESCWEAALADAPFLSLPAAAVLVVSPHPDDEVLGAGGLIRRVAQAKRSVTVLSVTDGEAAYPDWRNLGSVRCRELGDALRVLAPQITVHRLSIPDGQVNSRRADLAEALCRLLTPETLLVAPYELDGHPDHDATGEVCCEVARLRSAALWRYPIWTWHHRTPEQLAGKPLLRLLLDAGSRNAKARAISCFASQMRPFGRQPIVPAHVLRYFARPYEVYLA